MINPCKIATYSSVSIDNRIAAYELVSALIIKGHQRIAMIAAHLSESDRSVERYAGYGDALREHGLNPIDIVEVSFENLDLGDSIAELLVREDRPTAYFYFEPQGEFVADFIGTMNRIQGTATVGRFQTRGGSLPTPHATEGQSNLLFRPENARIVPVSQAPLSGTIASVFFLGDKSRLIISDVTDSLITIDAENNKAFNPGDPIGISVDPQHLLFV